VRFNLALIPEISFIAGHSLTPQKSPITPSGKLREGFRFSGYFTLLLAALGAVPAVISGLRLTNWDAVGSGVTLLHHYFVWPSFGLLIALVVWRSIARHRTSRIGFSIYLIAMLTTAVLISIAGFWGAKWF
jgi:hypothetical protein